MNQVSVQQKNSQGTSSTSRPISAIKCTSSMQIGTLRRAAATVTAAG
uniref:Uncharacterized protein n=1 Tax=Arundo donax TaxID=35708 RepID=A0A0A8ZRY7_ARUDO